MTANVEKMTLSVEETAKVLGISRKACYQAIWRGEIPSFKIGRRVLVRKRELMRIIEGESGDAKSV